MTVVEDVVDVTAIARRDLRGERRWDVGASEHRRLVDRFVAAAQTGDLESLERLLVADIAADRSPEPLAA